MKEDKIKQNEEQLNDEQLDEVTGGADMIPLQNLAM